MLIIFLLIWLGFMLSQLFMLKRNKHVHCANFLLLRVYLVFNYCFSIILVFPFLTFISFFTENRPLYIFYMAYFGCILIFNLLYFWFIHYTLSHPLKYPLRVFIWMSTPHLMIFFGLMGLFSCLKVAHI